MNDLKDSIIKYINDLDRFLKFDFSFKYAILCHI